MIKEKKNYGDEKHDEYELNPFVYGQEIKIKTKTRNLTAKTGTELIEKNGESSETYLTNIVQKKEVDTEEFIKLFTAQIKFYFDLTKTAYKVFFICLYMYQKEIGGDTVYLACKKAQNIAKSLGEFNISTAVYYRGIDELIEKKILAKSTTKYIYYINPAVIFNGDRARFVKEVIKKKEEMNSEIKSDFQDKEDDLDDLEKQILALKERKRIAEEKQKSIASVDLQELPNENIKEF